MLRESAFLASLFTFALAVAPLQDAVPGQPLQPWVKRGVILKPGFAGPRSTERLSAPSVVKLKNGRLRMYFWTATRLHENHIFAAEASPTNPFQWDLVKQEPMLGPGTSRNSRDKGPAFPWVVARDDGPWLMYYATSESSGPAPTRTGLALSHDQGITWEALEEPLLPIGKPGSHDAAVTGSVDVMRTGPERYFMWYSAGERYQMIGDITRLIVHIGMAHSTNGVDWTKHPQAVLKARLDKVDPFEAVVSKPCVLNIDGVYHMWFSVFRMEGVGYRLEYARSIDGQSWHRYADEEIIPLTPGGFDSTNQSYPFVIDMGRQLWMFYAGDRFGDTGIGLATLDKDELR